MGNISISCGTWNWRKMGSIQSRPNTYSHNGGNDILSISSEQVFGVDGLLSESHPNFENRPNQERYAHLVDDMINDHQMKGVIEAGTGLGKSMA